MTSEELTEQLFIFPNKSLFNLEKNAYKLDTVVSKGGMNSIIYRLNNVDESFKEPLALKVVTKNKSFSELEWDNLKKELLINRQFVEKMNENTSDEREKLEWEKYLIKFFWGDICKIEIVYDVYGNVKKYLVVDSNNETLSSYNLEYIQNSTDIKIEQTLMFILMEYAAGKTLKEKLRDQGSLSVHLSIFLFKKICVALKFFHEKYGIIHRDLKPENIMVLTGNTGIKIFDYGVSLNKKNLSEEEKKHFTNYGTFPYLNPKLIEISKNRKPEEIFELIDYTFDIYSIGIIFYEMLIGTKPFWIEGVDDDYNDINILNIALKYDYPVLHDINPNIPNIVDNIIYRCLSTKYRNNADAYKSIEEVLNNLNVLDEAYKKQDSDDEKIRKEAKNIFEQPLLLKSSDRKMRGGYKIDSRPTIFFNISDEKMHKRWFEKKSFFYLTIIAFTITLLVLIMFYFIH